MLQFDTIQLWMETATEKLQKILPYDIMRVLLGHQTSEQTLVDSRLQVAKLRTECQYAK